MTCRLLALGAAVPAFALAGFMNLVMVYESSTLQLLTADYVMAGMNPLGQLTEIPLGDGTFKIDAIQRHLVAPHFGEPMQGFQLKVSLQPVTPGMNAAPQKQTGEHGDHTDVWQAMLQSTAANTSKVYMRFDHTGDPGNVPTIDPKQFAPEALPIPEPATPALMLAAMTLLTGYRLRVCSHNRR